MKCDGFEEYTPNSMLNLPNFDKTVPKLLVIHKRCALSLKFCISSFVIYYLREREQIVTPYISGMFYFYQTSIFLLTDIFEPICYMTFL